MLTPGEADVLDEARATVKAVAGWFREQEAPYAWFDARPSERFWAIARKVGLGRLLAAVLKEWLLARRAERGSRS